MVKKTGILNQNKTSETENIITPEENLEKNITSELPTENDLNIKLVSEPPTEEIKLKSIVHDNVDEPDTTDENEDVVIEPQEILEVEKMISHNIGGDANLSKDAIRFYLRTGIKI